MKKTVKVILISVVLLILFGTPAIAADADDILDDFSDIIPDGIEANSGEELTAGIGFEAILEEIAGAVSEGTGSVATFFLMLFGFAVVMTLCDTTPFSDGGQMGKSIRVAVSMVASVSIFTSLYEVCTTVRTSLEEVVDFFSSVIPVLTLISTSSGATSTAAAQATNMNITLSLIGKFCTGALLPMSFAIFALSFASSIGDGGGASVARGVKSIFMWGTGLVSAILAASIAMQSVVASAADNATLRAARYAASGMIPIVGSTVSSALSTLGGGLAFVKSTVGMASVAVILLLTLAPLVSLLLYRLAFSACLIFLQYSGSEGGVRCFSAFKSALDALIAVYSMSTLVLVVEIVIFIKGGVSV